MDFSNLELRRGKSSSISWHSCQRPEAIEQTTLSGTSFRESFEIYKVEFKDDPISFWKSISSILQQFCFFVARPTPRDEALANAFAAGPADVATCFFPALGSSRCEGLMMEKGYCSGSKPIPSVKWSFISDYILAKLSSILAAGISLSLAVHHSSVFEMSAMWFHTWASPRKTWQLCCRIPQ